MASKCLTMTVEEVAETLGISRNSCYAAVRRGEIPALRVGHRIVVPRDAFARFMAQGGGAETESAA